MQSDDPTEDPRPVDEALRANLDAVRRRMREACSRAGRATETVRLVCVTKAASAGIIERLLRLEATDIGENRVQDAIGKMSAVTRPAVWHLIGHLQANKSRKAASRFSWIHSIDSVDLLRRVDRHALEAGVRPEVLLQVNVSGEASKHGFPPERVAEALRTPVRAVEIRGLMTIAPLLPNPDEARWVFRGLRELREELIRRGIAEARFTELSMGMTNDFEVAIEEGATIVRVGRALFEGIDLQRERRECRS